MSATENELGLLHRIVAEALTAKIKSGEYSASDVANAIKLLKDNNITCVAAPDTALGDLEQALKKKSPGLDQADLAAALENLQFNERAN